VTKTTFIFQNSPNTKSKEKKVGGHGILCPPRLKKWGDTRPPCPPPNCAHEHRHNVAKWKSHGINIFWIGWSQLLWHYKKWG